MKTLTKSLIVASVIGTVGAGGLATAGIASAESASGSADPMTGLVDKIASTFNLDKAKVQEVFDEQRETREQERQKKVGERLQALVENKTITNEQKSAIETKLAEMKKEREANKERFKDMTHSERKEHMEDERTELEDWADSQGIDLTKLDGVFKGPRGPGKPMR